MSWFKTIFSSVQFSHSVVSDSATPWIAARQGSLSIINSRSSLKLISTDSVVPSNYLILRHPLLLLPSIFPSIRVFSNESALRVQSKGLSRVFSNTTVQKHQFFVAQLSSLFNSHIHTWLWKKIIALTRWTFVGKVMSLLFIMLSRLVIAFLPRSKCLLVSWLQSPSAVILEPKKIKSVTVFHCFPIYLPWSDGTGCHDLRFLNVEL